MRCLSVLLSLRMSSPKSLLVYRASSRYTMTDINITDAFSSDSRERLFTSLDDLDASDELTVTAEHDPVPLFALYQLQRGRA